MSDILIEKFCTELLQRKLGFLVQIYAGYSKQDQFKILGAGGLGLSIRLMIGRVLKSIMEVVRMNAAI